MHFVSVAVLFAGLLSRTFATPNPAPANQAGQRASYLALKSVMERATFLCTPVPAPVTCEKSCGPGNIECISFPNCFNPGAGETCCADGTYCNSGYYCVDSGCCPNGKSLAECEAKSTQATLAGGVASTSTSSVAFSTPKSSTSAIVLSSISSASKASTTAVTSVPTSTPKTSPTTAVTPTTNTTRGASSILSVATPTATAFIAGVGPQWKGDMVAVGGAVAVLVAAVL
ncbi:hypothetical protein G7Y89_g9291 [Cudoniella acicularis]|uniref:Uncharacterized protein n=1 Tax=Cudoniella acicularis TaxID=354080 RepID=A0A8H4W215_9HELO|nr:hypothetical protein G7Y89_g9291 [Cudoniella acicularis]